MSSISTENPEKSTPSVHILDEKADLESVLSVYREQSFASHAAAAAHVGKRISIQPALASYYVPKAQAPPGLIFTCVTHGNWLRGSHFSDTETYIHVSRNPDGPHPASAADVRTLSSILQSIYNSNNFDSPRRVGKDLGEDIAALCSEHAKYEGYVQIKFGSVLAFWLAKRAAERAGGVWLKSEDGSQRITSGVKTYVDTCRRT
ncbi:hypothetical protein I350_07611 [Cryptococcus amylolentus CBS 6273]|uniref:Uncharacterized protein n=1 Tax=Cryptococcus amylolentus CBS 6273 TaxID=1296118 RepID=A0A1E3JAU7_9TREE|nr:hypothetical protein I350_07611 [Cryptococcus amylolentus CBS 6273]